MSHHMFGGDRRYHAFGRRSTDRLPPAGSGQ